MGCKIAVVGAGIIGATTTYFLQKAGAEVTLIDVGRANATQNSFGWINASFSENTHHFQLRAASIAAYRDLCGDLSLPINWCGALCWEEIDAKFDAQKDALVDLGYPTFEIDAVEFIKREPHVANPPDRCLFFSQEGAAESSLLAQKLIDAATALGARVIAGVTAQSVTTQDERVTGVRTDAGDIAADQVLVAAGTATENLMASADVHVPMLRRPALMLKTNPVAPILNHVLVSELGELRQLPDGSLLMPAAIGHQSDQSDALTSLPHLEADQALSRLQAMLPDVPLSWSHASIAHRPVPEDGLPVVGRGRDGLYVATMHSGITLAARMGQLIATEMLHGPTPQTTQDLAPYRAGRFSNQ